MTKDEIKAEFDAFIEFPEGSDGLFVTTTSTLIFAEHVAGLAEAEIKRLLRELLDITKERDAAWQASRKSALEAALKIIEDTREYTRFDAVQAIKELME